MALSLAVNGYLIGWLSTATRERPFSARFLAQPASPELSLCVCEIARESVSKRGPWANFARKMDCRMSQIRSRPAALNFSVSLATTENPRKLKKKKRLESAVKWE